MADTDWSEKIITFLIGGGAAGLGTWFISKRKADSDDFTILKDAYREEFTRYEAKFDKLNASYAKLESRYEALDQRNNELSKSLQSMRNSYPDLPIPMWLKDHSGIMISLNQAYEDAFLIPQGKRRSDYIGNRDESIWGDEIASTFRENDLVAIAQKKLGFVLEDQFSNDLLRGWHFFKYPKYVDGVFIGVGGMALPKSEDYKALAE